MNRGRYPSTLSYNKSPPLELGGLMKASEYEKFLEGLEA